MWEGLALRLPQAPAVDTDVAMVEVQAAAATAPLALATEAPAAAGPTMQASLAAHLCADVQGFSPVKTSLPRWTVLVSHPVESILTWDHCVGAPGTSAYGGGRSSNSTGEPHSSKLGMKHPM